MLRFDGARCRNRNAPPFLLVIVQLVLLPAFFVVQSFGLIPPPTTSSSGRDNRHQDCTITTTTFRLYSSLQDQTIELWKFFEDTHLMERGLKSKLKRKQDLI